MDETRHLKGRDQHNGCFLKRKHDPTICYLQQTHVKYKETSVLKAEG